MQDSVEILFTVPQTVDMSLITGPQDKLLRDIESRFDSRISVRGNEIEIAGSEYEVQQILSLFSDMIRAIEQGKTPTISGIEHTLDIYKSGEYNPSDLSSDTLHSYRGKAICPKTTGQKKYVDAIRNNTITFGIGPAGTGKTYLAVAIAINALKKRDVKRIILCRPVVEAGESLGFLPGTMEEKVNPYIQPLYDALYDMADQSKMDSLLDNNTIEIAPLAFMRGRTLNNAFVILDEAQNTTPEQMKMFLTRLGFGSKMVITGDISQIDLKGETSGLIRVQSILHDIDDIEFITLDKNDVVRHKLVAKIVDAYEKYDSKQIKK